ncbi:MAG: succinate dehydrogenase, cytochrome b556 subunit [Neisseriaceae bacterium]|nr:succinate dehydrogenase, cytochrome b556 subunit [Neisseriaceae bacterium]
MQKGPKYLDIAYIAPRMPIPAIISILHRITGVGLFICLPVLIWLLSGSLNSEYQFETYRSFIANPLVKIILILVLWAYLHHLFAGLRFLFLDAHKGLELQTARLTAKLVAFVAPVLALIVGVLLW